MAQYIDNEIKKYVNQPFRVGEKIKIVRENKDEYVTIISIKDNDFFEVRHDETYKGNEVVPKSICEKIIYDVGYNPFPVKSWDNNIECVGFDLEGIMISLGLSYYDCTLDKGVKFKNGVFVPEVTFNPYVVDKEENRYYYQREYCWSLEDEQLLVESVYNNLDCGKIVVRQREWNYVEKKALANDIEGLAFNDVVDGKQRLNCLHRFMTDKFPDIRGFYFSDLSLRARHKFEGSRSFTFLRFRPHTTDQEIIDSFLVVNFAGKPMSKEHIEYVKSIKERIS